MADLENATTPKLFILLQVGDLTLEDLYSALPEKCLLIRAGDLDIPIERTETPKQALLRWAEAAVEELNWRAD